MEFLISVFGFIILWIATAVGRKKESSIKTFSVKWFFMAALIATGAFIIKFADKWF